MKKLQNFCKMITWNDIITIIEGLAKLDKYFYDEEIDKLVLEMDIIPVLVSSLNPNNHFRKTEILKIIDIWSEKNQI